MNKKSLLVLPIVVMALTGCGDSSNGDTTSTTSPTTSTSIDPGTTTISPGTSVTRPDDGGHQSKDIGSALAYDYSNVTLFTGVSYNDGANTVIDYEYYDDNHIVTYSPDLVETYGSEYMSYAFTEYYVVGDKCYTYWEPEKGNPNSKGGWLTNGFQNAELAIWKAYFYLPRVLEDLEADDFSYILGNYYITDETLNAQFIEYVFSWVLYVDIGLDLPVDVAFQVDGETGAFSKIMAFFDDGDEDSENVVLIEFGDIGTTTLPTYGDFKLHEAPNENNTTTYWEYKGWEHDYQEAYYTALDIEVASSSNEYVTVGDDKHSVTAKLDKTFGVNLFTTPESFNPWDLVPYQSQEIIWEYDTSILRESYDYNYDRVFQTIKPGTTTIRAKVLGKDGFIYSDEITVTVTELERQNLENALYKFNWIGFTNEEEPNRIYASNDYANGLPCVITAMEKYGTKILDGKNGDITENGKNYLCFSPQQAMKPEGGPGAESSVLFDFDDQQVSELSFYFDLFYGSQKTEFFKTFESMTISTSNDGETWNTIDITNTIKEELSVEFWKLCDVKFAPATLVKIDVTAWMHGGNGTLCLDSVAFSADENCHAHGTSTSVDVTDVMLSASNLEVEVDEEVTLTALVLPENATNQSVTWSSDNEAVATVDANGKVKGISAGLANISVTTVDGGFTKSCAVSVYDHPVLPSEWDGTYECDERIATIILDSSTNSMTFTADDVNITLPLKKLDDKTMVFSDGINKITATKDSTGLYLSTGGSSVINGNSLAGSWSFTKIVEATNFKVNVSYATELEGGKYGLRVGSYAIVTASNFTPSDANLKEVTWEVVNGTGVATYDEEYSQLNAVSAGTVTLVATLNGKVSKEVEFVISEPVTPTSITISGENEVLVGENIKLTANVNPSNADNKSVTWESGDTSVATVSSTGQVKGIKAGTVTITATSVADPTIKGTYVVTVLEGVSEIIPAGLVGDWDLGYDNEEMCEESGYMTINSDGTLSMTLNIYGEMTVEFEFVNKSGNVFSFTGVDEYIDMTITYSNGEIESVWVDDGNFCFYAGCEMTFSSVTKA